ncbi:hypothetical protein CALCODRAFT_484337 [Calocera cornea HHB12733]|uniref:Uncharacterized protein n=1 Tax=Calocera cornea HHB12733 TaxID=1353952 RepID=A0A165F211_9BASI|nr:hypothetical protein CALCODRAFT_484337 [Calocera cornea HHB12733]
MDQQEELYHQMRADSAAEAALIQCRLACINVMRHAVHEQDEEENPSAPPPYDPAWRYHDPASNTDSTTSSRGVPVSAASPTTAPPTKAPAVLKHDIRIYSDSAALQQYRQARCQDIKSYREQHGLTSITARVANWWKNLYGGLTFDELIP